MKIALVGDVMLGRLVNDKLRQVEPAYPWGNTLSIFQNADLRICNLECVLSDVGEPWSATPKVFHFRTDEKNIRTLQTAEIDLVSIANNHVLDYDYVAFLRMLDVLDREKIFHAGAGRNWQEAIKPAICEVKNQKIGFIAITDNEPDWVAKKNQPGIFYLPIDIDDSKAQDLFKQITQLRQEVDYLIVSAHWGPNWGYSPPDEQIPFAYALIDAGADLIFGHSGHIFRGIEVYKNRPIIYCAGDFIDDYAVDEIENNDESFIFLVEMETRDSITLRMYPTCISRFQANLATFNQKDAILSKMQSLCKELGTTVKSFPDHIFIEISQGSH
jgi:poly-gamma-glutamate synthesis protein (capsule biosynthesis protein)